MKCSWPICTEPATHIVETWDGREHYTCQGHLPLMEKLINAEGPPVRGGEAATPIRQVVEL